MGISLCNAEAMALSTFSLDLLDLMEAIRAALIIHEQDKLWLLWMSVIRKLLANKKIKKTSSSNSSSRN